ITNARAAEGPAAGRRDGIARTTPTALVAGLESRPIPDDDGFTSGLEIVACCHVVDRARLALAVVDRRGEHLWRGGLRHASGLRRRHGLHGAHPPDRPLGSDC